MDIDIPTDAIDENGAVLVKANDWEYIQLVVRAFVLCNAQVADSMKDRLHGMKVTPFMAEADDWWDQ